MYDAPSKPYNRRFRLFADGDHDEDDHERKPYVNPPLIGSADGLVPQMDYFRRPLLDIVGSSGDMVMACGEMGERGMCDKCILKACPKGKRGARCRAIYKDARTRANKTSNLKKKKNSGGRKKKKAVKKKKKTANGKKKKR